MCCKSIDVKFQLALYFAAKEKRLLTLISRGLILFTACDYWLTIR